MQNRAYVHHTGHSENTNLLCAKGVRESEEQHESGGKNKGQAVY